MVDKFTGVLGFCDLERPFGVPQTIRSERFRDRHRNRYLQRDSYSHNVKDSFRQILYGDWRNQEISCRIRSSSWFGLIWEEREQNFQLLLVLFLPINFCRAHHSAYRFTCPMHRHIYHRHFARSHLLGVDASHATGHLSIQHFDLSVRKWHHSLRSLRIKIFPFAFFDLCLTHLALENGLVSSIFYYH